MAELQLSTVRALVEKTIYHNIRDVAVRAGYAADREKFQGKKEYEAEQERLSKKNGFVVEVFGVGNNQAKGLKQTPRIVVVRKESLAGDLGGEAGLVHELTSDESKYESKIRPPRTTNYTFHINMVSANIAQDRVVHSIISQALPKRRYISLWNSDTRNFYTENDKKILVINDTHYDITDHKQGIMEAVYTYTVPDVYETLDTVYRETAKITSIQVGTDDLEDNIISKP